MFLGGGDQTAPITQIRGTSFRGALAFWWRALQLAPLCAEFGDAALPELRKREIELFGGPGGQAAFFLSIRHAQLVTLRAGEILTPDGSGNGASVGPGCRYLGYGVVEGDQRKPSTLLRPVVMPSGDTKFDLIVTATSRLDPKRFAELVEAIRLLGLLGGLGARARRGFGSLTLTDDLSLEGTADDVLATALRPVPKTVDAFTAELARIVRAAEVAPITDMPITAFGDGMGIVTGANHTGWHDALDRIGRGFLRYRAWGFNGKFGDERCDQSFGKDHDWFRSILPKGQNRDTARLKSDTYVPQRVAFGLPHNYHKDVGVKGQGGIERRASPLMFHVQKIDGGYCPVATFLPSRFLPDDAVEIGGVRKAFAFPEHTQVVTDYLDGIRHDDGGKRVPSEKPYFPTDGAPARR